MSQHIDEQRLMEIALGAVSSTDAEEQHLVDCQNCADILVAEQGLTNWLTTVPQPVAPDNFMMRLDQAFVHHTRGQTERTPIYALMGVAALLLPALVVVASAWSDVLARLSSWVVALRALTEVGYDVMHSAGSPQSPGLMLVAIQAAMLIAGVGVLTRLMWVTAPAGREASQ